MCTVDEDGGRFGAFGGRPFLRPPWTGVDRRRAACALAPGNRLYRSAYAATASLGSPRGEACGDGVWGPRTGALCVVYMEELTTLCGVVLPLLPPLLPAHGPAMADPALASLLCWAKACASLYSCHGPMYIDTLESHRHSTA